MVRRDIDEEWITIYILLNGFDKENMSGHLKIAGQSEFQSGLSINFVKTSIVKSQVLVMSKFMDFYYFYYC